MLVTTGGCATECDQRQVAFTQLTKQGMHLMVRSTLVRIMALFAAMHCYKTPSSELVEFRQNCRLDFQQQLAACMVGTLHTMSVYVLMHTYVCYHSPPHLRVVPLWPQAHVYMFGIKCSSGILSSKCCRAHCYSQRTESLTWLAMDHVTGCL